MNSLRLAIINWKTTLPGGLFVLALYLHQNPDALSGLVDPALAKQIAGWASLLTGFATFATSKASNVSGNGTVSNPAKIAQADGSNTVLAPSGWGNDETRMTNDDSESFCVRHSDFWFVPTAPRTSRGASARHFIVAALLIPALAFQGCAQIAALQANPTVQTIEKVGFGIGLDLAATAATGGTIDAAWAAPLAINSISQIVSTMRNKDAANLISSTVTQFGRTKSVKTAAQTLATAYLAADPQTQQEKAQTIVNLATGLSNGLAKARADARAQARVRANDETRMTNDDGRAESARPFERIYGEQLNLSLCDLIVRDAEGKETMATESESSFVILVSSFAPSSE